MLATLVGAASCVAAACIFLPAPNVYIEIQAVRFSEHSAQLTLVCLGALALTFVAWRLARRIVWCLPALTLSIAALLASMVPAVQAQQLANQYSIRLDPLRTLRPARLLNWPYTTVVYSTVDGQDLSADVFQPTAHSNPAPVVVVVHGGGWDSGARSDYLPWNEWLAQQGFVVVTIEYRLKPQPNWPAAALDVREALAWVRHNAGDLGADPNRVALVGRSAGGHLALLAAYAQGATDELPPPNQPVQAVAALYSPTDLAWAFAHPANPRVYDIQSSLRNFLGGDPSSYPERYASASPALYVRSGVDLPPTLLMHGGHDQLVPLQQMYLLSDALQRVGARVETIEIPYGQHGFDLPFEGWSSQLTQEILLRFLRGALSRD